MCARLPAGLNRSYDYDAFDRLISEVDNVGPTLWTYDANSAEALGSNSAEALGSGLAM